MRKARRLYLESVPLNCIWTPHARSFAADAAVAKGADGDEPQ